MRKRLSSKLLALVLTFAICATTVLGCLMTVSAAESCYTFGIATFPSEDDLTQATIDVTFTANDKLPNGFAAGQFTLTEVDADAEDYLTVKSVTAVTEGVNLVNEGNFYIFDGAGFESVTFALTFGFSQGEASKTGKEYKIKLTDVELYDSDDAYFVQDDEAGAVGTISAGCKHVITVVGQPLDVDTANNYSVYEKSVCTRCGEQFGYQLVPTADKLGGDAAQSEGATIQWDGSSKTAPTEGSGTEADPYIISDVAHLAYITEAGPDVTHGKYYKVKDGIKNIVLQSAADAQTLINIDSAEEARTYIEGLSGRSNWGSSKYDAATAFAGVFDGNGATIYGLSASGSRNISLFGSIGPKAEFKNLSIKNSFVQTGWYAATLAHAVQGYTLADGTAVAKGTVKIDNCTFANNYINPQSGVNGGTSGNQCIGVILGNFNNSATGSGLAVNKVMTYGNITFYEQQQANISPLFGMINNPPASANETETEYCELMDCILLDVPGDIFATNNSNFKSYPNVQNVYSDSTWVQQYLDSAWYNTNDANTVTKAQMLGSSAITAAPNLAWGSTWLAGKDGELPSLTAPDYVSDTLYWDGSNTKTAPTVGTGEKDNPYIISTIAEFAYITGQGRDNYAITDGKYYKIADGIKNIVMQPYAYANDIMALNSAAATKSYFETNAANLKQWLYYGWEGSTFCGNIDFNGATVYGVYQVSSSNAGLISNVDGNAVISNLTIKNSYMVSQSSGANYQVGAIVANTNAASYGKATIGFVWFNNCTVANNYLYGNSTSHDRSAVIIGSSSDVVYIDNCLVYGNDATYGSGVAMGIWSSASNNLLVSSNPAIPEGLDVVTDGNETARYYNMVRNSIILGAKPYDLGQGKGSRFNDPECYENVYTDANVATDTFGGTTTVLGATDEQIKTISATDALGSAAKTAMPNLAWGTDWYCGAVGQYPVQASVATVGASSVATPGLELVGTSVTYKNDGNLDFNLHFVPEQSGINPVLYVGTLDCSKFMKLEAVESSKTAELGANALMFTIPNLSARDIDLVWLPTVVLTDSAIVEWGRSSQIALADNAKAIIAGDYDSADKNVSAALINYGNAADAALAIGSNDYKAGTIDLLEFGDYLTEAGSTSKYWDTNVADNGETGDSWDNAIIIDNAEEFVYLCKASGDDTKGKYYKVADGIAGFNLSTNKLDPNKSLAANLDIIKGSGKNHSGNTPGFQGHFDGNGVTVYGAWTNHTSISNYAGLFTAVQGEVSIKNVNVKLSSFTAKIAAGGIVGYYKGEGTFSDNTSLTIENCSVTDSHLEIQNTGYGSAVGAIVGRVDCPSSYVDAADEDKDGDTTDTVYINNKVKINNCYVNLDETYFISPAEDGTEESGERACHGGVAGVLGTNALTVSNCVVIGITPYATSESTSSNDVQHSGLESHFANVYTTAATGKINIAGTAAMQNRNFTGKVFQLTLDEMTGAAAKENMPTLDWANTWTVTDGYPTFISTNYKSTASRTIYYTGTATTIGTVAPSQGSGTKDDPFIINTVEELAYVTGQTTANIANVQGKYFKVADGISAIVLQKEDYVDDILALGSAAETKAYFEANKANMVKWPNYGWEGSTFCGNIDFNGATVYGLFQESDNNAGLFSTIEAGAVISNLGIRNSYITSTNVSYNVGAIAAYSNSSGYAAKANGVIWVKNATIANNYIYGAHDTTGDNNRVGVAYGSISGDNIYTDNILVYGNDATYGAGYKAPLMPSAGNAVDEDAAVPEGLVIKYTGTHNTTGKKLHTNVIRNSIILGCTPYDLSQGNGSRFNDLNNCYENIYTDADFANDKFSNGTAAASIKNTTYVADYSILKGDAAQSIVDSFNESFGSTAWYVGAAGDYPGFKPATGLSVNLQAIYDGITFTAPDTIGDGTEYNSVGNMTFGVYQTALSLKANPYMSFAFAFHGDYKINRDKIQIRFTYIVNGQEDAVEIAVPAYEEGKDIVNVNGWTNTAKNGRFHTYKATDIPVEALANGIKIEASYNGGEWKDFGTFSIEGIGFEFEKASKLQPGDYYATRVEAAKALLFYTQMIHARYGSVQ